MDGVLEAHPNPLDRREKLVLIAHLEKIEARGRKKSRSPGYKVSMSLTYQLNDTNSPVSTYFRQHFPRTESVVRLANRNLDQFTRAVPKSVTVAKHVKNFLPEYQKLVRDGDLVPVKSRMWGFLRDDLQGMALECRLRYYFAVPSVGHLATAMERQLRASVPQYQLLSPQTRLALKDGKWVYEELPRKRVGPVISIELVVQFFERLHESLIRLRPVGNALDDQAEGELLRYCILLAVFEKCHRDHSLDLFDKQPYSTIRKMKRVDSLLKFPQDHWVDHLRSLSRLFHAQCIDLIG
jgi:hypothetical protein